MFIYKSETVRSTMKNGKGIRHINRINIKNNKGSHESLTQNMKGKTLKKTRKNLNRKNIQIIREGKKSINTPFPRLLSL